MAWFPGNDHPSDKAAYDISVTVPKDLQAVSNGELKSDTADGGRRTYRWHTAEPMATYLATVAIGHFDITRGTLKDGLPLYVAVDPTSRRRAAPSWRGFPRSWSGRSTPSARTPSPPPA